MNIYAEDSGVPEGGGGEAVWNLNNKLIYLHLKVLKS